MPDTNYSPHQLFNVTYTYGDNMYLPVMIDLEYNPNNSLVLELENIVKNDTIIYCGEGPHCPACDEALNPIVRVVTYNSCQPTMSQPPPSQPTMPKSTASQRPTSSSLGSVDGSKTPSFISVHFFNLLFHLVNLILLLIIGWKTNRAINAITTCACGGKQTDKIYS